jgi:hypothetical protein
MPLAWPIGGVSAYSLLEDATPQLCMAMEDVIRLGHLYFSYLSFSMSDCEQLRDSIDMCQALSEEAWQRLEKGMEWLCMLALRACHDMVQTG